MTDELVFKDERKEPRDIADQAWTVLIVDDEEEVHAVTKLALSDFEFCGRRLRFVHAYSAAEAKMILRERSDIALVLLDVVMESETAGLSVVEFVRNELGNRFLRIILRTGQPGQAPELDVIRLYDINDYKNKTELTQTRLYTTIYTSLSAYRDLVALDANRRGLEKVIEASAHIFELQSLAKFTQGVLEQLTALLFLGTDAVMIHASGAAVQAQLEIVAGTGSYALLSGQNAREALPATVLERIEDARRAELPIYGKNYFVRDQRNGDELIFYVGADAPLSVPDRSLIDLFCQNVAIAYKNVVRFEGLSHSGTRTDQS
jgi:CheY-like chemotaxis protein